MKTLWTTLLLIALLLAASATACQQEAVQSDDTDTTAAPIDTPTSVITEGTDAAWVDLTPADTMPPARNKASMVYEPQTEQVLLFGGYSQADGSTLGDLWAFDPTADSWTELLPNGSTPSAREGQALAYDSGTGTIFLFGGYTGLAYQNDTWAYDPLTSMWEELDPSGDLPTARSQHTLVYDSKNAQLLLYGGWDGDKDLSDLWAFDPASNTWTELAPNGELPTLSFNPVGAYEDTSGKLYVFGGFPDVETHEESQGEHRDFLNELWAYDPSANEWSQIGQSGDLPAGRNGHGLAADPVTGRLVLFAGTGEGSFNDLWTYDIASDAWTQILPAGDLPQVRAYPAMAFDEKDNMIVVFSGQYWMDWRDLEDTWGYPLGQ